MRNILIGNGVTIQFGGKDYLNDRIIKRAINNVNTKRFNPALYPREARDWIIMLHSQIPSVLNGKYDRYVIHSNEKRSLESFKYRYSNFNKSKRNGVHHVGFEDYFLLHHLAYNKTGRPDRYQATGGLKRFFIDSIYNSGKIQEVHTKYPSAFVSYLREFDIVFTTNYDQNIEKAAKREVKYLHGSFHQLDEVYDPDSFRNKLSDRPSDKTPVVPGFEHLYSNALTSYSGEDKMFTLNQGRSANSGIEKSLNYIAANKEEGLNMLEDWKKADNKLINRVAEMIELAQYDKEHLFKEYSAISELSECEGELVILGLSPNNDTHLFDIINQNSKLTHITFYYFDPSEAEEAIKLFESKIVLCNKVIDFWENYE
ncbi:hypothetical protein ACIQLG_03865 [Terribacillus saccharophilus]|uniref:hypothetical protein n=1 Tax=Terribacillus saccharophilus TaxID=361277 RepID=UPI00380669D0